MKFRPNLLRSIFSLTCVLVLTLSFSLQTAYAQNDPLTLAQVLTGLQSKSSGFSLDQKNSIITKDILNRGITFRVSAEIESELKRAGASSVLIDAVRSKSSRTAPTRITNPNAPPIVEFDNTWVDYNVVEEGKKGMRVHTKFTLRNLKDIPLQLTVRLQKDDGDTLTSSDSAYRNKGGQLAVFRPIKAGYVNAVYQDYAVFIPYSAFKLAPGKYNLQLDADIIYPDGELLKHLTLYPFTFTQAATTQTPPPSNNGLKPNVRLEKMWIDYNVTQGGQTGMLVHTKITVFNLLNENVVLALFIEKADGSNVYAKRNSTNRAKDGNLTFFKDLKPQYEPALFNDLQVFVPYSEIVLEPGMHNLKIHADIVKPGTDMNLHIDYYPFTFRSGSNGNYY